MTESEWLSSRDPAAMLKAIEWDERRTPPSLISERKLRLFACACAREMGPENPDAALCLAEVWADIGIEQYEPTAASKIEGLHWCYWPDALAAAKQWASANSIVSFPVRAALLREIVGNPWKLIGRQVGHGGLDLWPLIPVLGLHLADRIKAIAQTIYDGRSFDDMPILADSLLDAGCDNEEILRHCRGEERCEDCLGGGIGRYLTRDGDYEEGDCANCKGTGWRPLRGPHVRGCWVIDLILGKE